MQLIDAQYWQVPERFEVSATEPSILSWLLEKGSVTTRLKANAKNFRLQLLQQSKLNVILPWAVQSQTCLVREVLLVRNCQACIYGYSYLPETTMARLDLDLANLGETPLGEIIFKQADLKRTQLSLARLPVQAELFQQVSNCVKSFAVQALYSRCITYTIAQQPFIVTETFLPAMWQQYQIEFVNA